MSADPLLSPNPEELARFARVEPPAELDAWMRVRLRAAIAERAPGVPPELAPAVPARVMPARAAAAVPFIERLALGVGAVACGLQASSLLRMVWSALTLGR